MTSDLKTFVTDEWMRDALRVVLVNHVAHLVAVVRGGGPGQGTPMLAMTPYDAEEAMTRDDEAGAGILLPLDVARALYEALGRHFGDHQDPASRELVAAWEKVAMVESGRVDDMLGTLLKLVEQPTTVVLGGEKVAVLDGSSAPSQ